MRVRDKHLGFLFALSLAVFAGLLLGFAGDAGAGGDKRSGFGQYLVVKAAGDSPAWETSNPTSTSMYGCLIHYDGDFESCTCEAVGPMATFSTNTPFGNGHVEWISAPNTGKSAGKITKNAGMIGRAVRGIQARSLNPVLFKLHPNSTQRSNMLTDCCAELANDGISKTFFSAFDDFICP